MEWIIDTGSFTHFCSGMKRRLKMRNILAGLIAFPLLQCWNLSIAQSLHSSGTVSINYTPDSRALYDSIVALDSILFSAYNTCDLATQAALFSDSIEFYHDQGGLTTSKDTLIARTKRNICGKVTRELVKGSIEVYPIAGYGAVELGLHKFHTKMEPDAVSDASRFIIVWQHQNKSWKIRRVISLH